MNAEGDPIHKFKAQIGFDRIVEAGGPNSGVVVEWPKPDTCPTLAGTGWSLESVDVEPRDSGAEGEWILKKGNETILLRIFVSCMGPAPARQQLIDIATATMMMEIPFKKSAHPIGTLSVTVPGAEDGIYIWIFRNICFYARGIDTNADIEAFAGWIQLIAESGVVEDLHSHLPRIKSVKIDPPVVNVDGAFSVQGILDAGSNLDVTRYSFDFRHDEQALGLEDDEANVARFTARMSGDANITVHVVDRKTLLSNWLTAVVKVEK